MSVRESFLKSALKHTFKVLLHEDCDTRPLIAGLTKVKDGLHAMPNQDHQQIVRVVASEVLELFKQEAEKEEQRGTDSSSSA